VQGGVQLTDPFNVDIAAPKCGYNDSWSLRTQDEIDDALNHEQGHFNLSALLARDFFVDVMLLKQQTFATAALCFAEIDAIKKESLEKVFDVQQAYDLDRFSRGRAAQRIWDQAIQDAFNRSRASGTVSVDGKPHKARLVVVLRGVGIKV